MGSYKFDVVELPSIFQSATDVDGGLKNFEVFQVECKLEGGKGISDVRFTVQTLDKDLINEITTGGAAGVVFTSAVPAILHASLDEAVAEAEVTLGLIGLLLAEVDEWQLLDDSEEVVAVEFTVTPVDEFNTTLVFDAPAADGSYTIVGVTADGNVTNAIPFTVLEA